MTGWRPELAALALVMTGCATQGSEVAVPAGAVVLPAASIPALIEQCSRDAPPPGEGAWQPGGADIVALEAALPAALGERDPSGWRKAPGNWRRQYVGLLRGGRRYVYGNFVPVEMAENGPWQLQPVQICDGGPSIFGVEYDVAAGHITHIAHNGPY